MLLHELLDEVATGDEPPSRLTADEVYAAGQRRRRTTAAARIGAAAVLVVALVTALVVFAPARAPDPAVGPPVAPEIRAIGGYDKDHLYVVVLPCGTWNCDAELRVTRDGGRTWTTRGTQADVNLTDTPWEIHVSRAGTVGVFSFQTIAGGPAQTMFTSVDGGRSFAQIVPGGRVEAAPPDALVQCAYSDRPAGGQCVVQVVDLDAGTAGSLATQPALLVVNVTRSPDGTIWALGRDDNARRPAVASSTDGGRTWATHAFVDAPEFTADHRVVASQVAAVDGTVVVQLTYAPFDNPTRNANVAFRLRDGDWQRLDTDALGPGAMAAGASYLAADGTFVLQKIAADVAGSSPTSDGTPPVSPPTTPWSSGGPPWSSGRPAPPSGGSGAQEPRIGIQYWSCPPGATTYRRIDAPTGLSGDPLAVERLPGGGYIARSSIAAWVSTDGRSWKRIVIR